MLQNTIRLKAYKLRIPIIVIAIITAPVHIGSLFYLDWLMFQSTDAAAAGTGFLLGNMNVWGTKQFIFSHILNKDKTFFCFKWALAAKIL